MSQRAEPKTGAHIGNVARTHLHTRPEDLTAVALTHPHTPAPPRRP
ncbi:hypothetical protein [Streptomyces sp. DW26H14]